jgi:hypothetical protein
MALDRLFTQDQQSCYLKDQALFSDTIHQRKRAINELVRNYADNNTALSILAEIIDACPMVGDEEFKQFCLALKSNLEAEQNDLLAIKGSKPGISSEET